MKRRLFLCIFFIAMVSPPVIAQENTADEAAQLIRLETTIGQLNERIGSIENRLDRIESRLDSSSVEINSRLDATNSRLDVLLCGWLDCSRLLSSHFLSSSFRLKPSSVA